MRRHSVGSLQSLKSQFVHQSSTEEKAAATGKKSGEASAHGSVPVLHTGDVVLLRCRLPDSSSQAQRSGFVCADGTGLQVVPMNGTAFGDAGFDVRDFFFIVIEQLSYTAQKDLRRRQKHLESKMDSLRGSTLGQQLKRYEQHAKNEASQNAYVTNSRQQGLLKYGAVIQLQHLRTQLFLGVRAKLPALLVPTARRIELQAGSVSCWLRVNPAFVHRMQGEPVPFSEQVSLECTKLGNSWNLGCSRIRTATGDVTHEISCFKEGTNFSFVLYSRALPLQPGSSEWALGFGCTLRLQHAQQAGFLTASCSTTKHSPFIRCRDQGGVLCAKDVWVTERLQLSRSELDLGIEYNHTPVMLRHLGSGRYLSVSEEELLERGRAVEVTARTSPITRSTRSYSRMCSHLEEMSDNAQFITAQLSVTPGPTCVFLFEPTAQNKASGGLAKHYVPHGQASVLVRWDGTPPLWLSCCGLQKGRNESLELQWVHTRNLQDTFKLETLDDHPAMFECDAVAMHRRKLEIDVMPRLRRHVAEEAVPPALYSEVERLLSNVIFFLADTPSSHHEDKAHKKHDALKAPWTAKPERQRFARELKYIDLTFELFEELAKQSPTLLNAENLGFHNRMSVMNLNSTGGAADDEEAVANRLSMRCLKLVTRLWLHCFLGSRKNEGYFHRNGWMDTIDRLNGLGLGASDVFVALVSNNPQLVRCIGSGTMQRFIEFIRLMGPLDTWLFFLKALCAPQGQAVSMRQQDLLKNLVFRGHRANEAERNATLTNRKELLVWVRLDEPIGAPLGQASPGQSAPWDDCLAQGLLNLGVHDVAVSWAHPERWEVGKGVLYHGPKVLKLPRLASRAGRSWVSLAQVVWVLEPERCCEAVTGMVWEHFSHGEEHLEGAPRQGAANNRMRSGIDPVVSFSRIESLRMLAKYILAQFRLIADLVKDQQMNCIMALQEEYSFGICLSGAADTRLPRSIRSAFFDILSHLWLDRHPHTEVVLPDVMRAFPPAAWEFSHRPESLLTPDAWSDEHLRSLPEEVCRFYRLAGPAKFEALLQVLRSHLCSGAKVEQQVHSKDEENAMTVAALRCLSFLIGKGFVRSRELLSGFLGPLLRLFDGRTDWLEPPNTDSHDGHLGTEEEGLVQGEATPLLHSRPSRSLEHSSFGLLQPERPHFPPLAGAEVRYVDAGANKSVHESKVQLARVLLQLGRSAADVRISQVLRAFQLPGRATSDAVLAVLDDPALKLEQNGIWSPNVMFIDLLMYENQTLFPLALELLSSNCSRTSEFLEQLGRVKLLNKEQAELAAMLRRETYAVGKLVDNFENWGVDDEFSTVQEQKLSELQRICKRVRRLCSVGDSHTTTKEVQDMLRQTEFFSEVRYSLELDPTDFIPSSRHWLAKVTCALCSAAAAALRGNPTNQELVFGVAPSAAKFMDEMPECALLLTEVFRGNVELCQRVPEDLVRLFGDLVWRERRLGHFVPWYLTFFSVVVSVGPVPVPRNQRLVIETIQRLKPKMTLRLLEVTVDRLKQLASSFRSAEQLHDPDPSTWSSADGELIYYIRSVELLVGLARSLGSEALVNKPLVKSFFPASEAIRLLLQVDHPREQRGFSIYRCLRTRWLQVLHLTVYDIEGNLVDEELLGSPVHVMFFQALLDWVEEALDLVPVEEVSDESPQLDESTDEYVCEMLHCVDAFFHCPYRLLQGRELCADIVRVAQGVSKCFRPLVQQGPGRRVPRHRLQAPELLQTIALRVLNNVSPRAQLTGPALGSPAAGSAHPAHRSETHEAQKKWQAFLQTLRADPRVKKRIRQEQEELGRVLLHIGDLTDPEQPDYVKRVPTDERMWPDGMDFRRNKVSKQEVMQRLVRHSQAVFAGDLVTLRRVLRSLLAMICVSAGDSSVGQLHMQFVRAKATQLIVQVLGANLAEDIEELSWELLVALLQASRGSQKLQAGLFAAFRGMDDSGLWESFQDLVDDVGESVKRTRGLQRLPSLTQRERWQLREYRRQLHRAGTAMKALRLMVEGHFVPMQDYLFSQVGNLRSVNVLASAVWLLTRLCKDPVDADFADEPEFRFVGYILELLTELAQGPNLRNQEFLSTQGLIEAVFKLLAAGFVQLQRAAGDLYPASVQELKAKLVETLLALLEGRLDATIHNTLLLRVDRLVLRERIRFVYLYFVFGTVAIADQEVESEASAAVPLDGRTQRLLLPTVDATELHGELLKASSVAEELLEDLDEQGMDMLFSEGLDCVQVCLELSPHSREFEIELMPHTQVLGSFVDDPKHYATRTEYLSERTAFHQRDVYRMSFGFLSRFVATIEVVLNGHLQNLHFQQPLTAMWYCSSSSKERILDTVPLTSVDAKTKVFIQMCEEVHRESMLIRRLSRFSILSEKHRKWAQRHLPDGLHRPFQAFLANDARRMQQLLYISLFLSAALALHVGVNLVPVKEDAKGSRRAAWSSDVAAFVSEALGGFHFACTLLWLALTACIKVPLNLQGYRAEGKRGFEARARAVFAFARDGYVTWRLAQIAFCGAALFAHQCWLYSFLIVDCFCQNSRLATVLRGIAAPARSWLMTFIGMMIVTFVYAAVGFHNFREEFGAYCGENIALCTANIIYQGSRSGVIGLSSMMKEVSPGDPSWGTRLAYDVSYFFLFGVMLLNAVVALVVDSFSALRREAEAREHTLSTETFISGLDRKVIDTVAQAAGINDGFDYHETHRQNKWVYMSFIFFLLEKRAEDYTGPEQTIRQLVENKDVKWLPLGRSKMLQAEDEVGQSVLERIEQQTLNVERELRSMGQQCTALHARLGSLQETVLDKKKSMDQERMMLLSSGSNVTPSEGLTRSRRSG